MQHAAFLFEDDGNYRQAEALLSRIVVGLWPEHPEAITSWRGWPDARRQARRIVVDQEKLCNSIRRLGCA